MMTIKKIKVSQKAIIVVQKKKREMFLVILLLKAKGK